MQQWTDTTLQTKLVKAFPAVVTGIAFLAVLLYWYFA
ncbi:hypothetical protein TALC_00992 [Thermoplasmatales archaeon BRNA1]|nr:hypothetical protein TALC_00992 [Thermoplasmatales archaeon BRNA1]